MNFTKALKRKSGAESISSKPRKPDVDISQLISGKPVVDENSVLELDTDLVINKDQVRTQFNDEYIEELGNSMVELGQIQAIVVSPVNKEGKYVIQKGECRWRAARLKGLKVFATVDFRSLNDIEIILGELAENIQRDDLKPLEIAVAIKNLKDSGMSQGVIAKKMGKNDAYVSRHMKLLTMPEYVKQLYLDEVVVDVQTLNNLSKLNKINSDRVKALCQSVRQTGMTRKLSESFLKEEAEIGQVFNKERSGHSPAVQNSTETGGKQTNFAHVQNLADEEHVLPNGTQEHEETNEAKYHIDSTVSAKPEAQEQAISNGKEEKDFNDGRPGMFGIEVQMKDGRSGVICLDRKDKKSDYMWVKVESGKERVHIKQLSIVRTVG